MFFSLIQTLVCVLLVNGGLYALHLTGSSTNSNSNSPASNNNGHSSSSAHTSAASAQLKNPSLNPFQTSSSRFNEELADLAQLERERLMVMGLAKQTAEESGYHGRPIITGRIKMHPVEDLDSDYSAWLSQQARNVMFGSVVKQPTPALLNDGAANEDDYDSLAGAAVNYEAAPRRPTKYDYGRVVQPVEREFESPHTLDLDDFMELETVAEEEDRFPDMDGYAYLEDLMAEENKERMQRQQAHHQNVPHFPGYGQQAHHSNPYVHGYQAQAQELFEQEQPKPQHSLSSQHRSAAEQQQHEFNAKYRNNIRVQQKWQRKRAQLQQQQQPQLPRNIFGQKNKQQHYFKTQSTNKFSLANSEATATSKVNNQHQQQQQQQQQTNDNQVEQTNQAALNKTDKAATTVSAVGEQQKPDQMLHPNHKRSGVGGGGSSGGMSSSAAAVAAVTSPHSLANQLMLRSARGQRQYDVPQIECPTAMDGMERFACPTPDVQGRYRCIDDHVLCDGFIDCPEGEDEDRRSCMFYKTTKAHLDVLADALLRWARGR